MAPMPFFLIFPRVFFAAYGVGSVALAIADVFAPQSVAGGSRWGVSPGWMREIAALDVFVAWCCFASIRAIGKNGMPVACAGGLCLLSVLIASNNFAAYAAGAGALHLQGAISHVVGAACGALVVWMLRKER
jgi:hypothetical protein